MRTHDEPERGNGGCCMRKSAQRKSRPTILPWSYSGIAGDTSIMGARALRYEGWPNFGKPVVCDVRYSASVEEGEVNKEFIVAACNACFAVNPSNPLAAANGYPALLRA